MRLQCVEHTRSHAPCTAYTRGTFKCTCHACPWILVCERAAPRSNGSRQKVGSQSQRLDRASTENTSRRFTAPLQTPTLRVHSLRPSSCLPPQGPTYRFSIVKSCKNSSRRACTLEHYSTLVSRPPSWLTRLVPSADTSKKDKKRKLDTTLY